MVINKHLVFILLLISHECLAENSPIVGFVKYDGKGNGYLYTPKMVHRNDHIISQFPNKNGGAECCVSLAIEKVSSIAKDIVVTDEHLGKNVYRALIKESSKSEYPLPFLGVAVIGENVTVTQNYPDFLEVKNLNQKSIVRTCTSNEGVHLIESSPILYVWI